MVGKAPPNWTDILGQPEEAWNGKVAIIDYIDSKGQASLDRLVTDIVFRETKAGDLVMTCNDQRSGQPRSFRLDRIISIEVNPTVTLRNAA